MNKQPTSKGITISFIFSPEVEQEFNHKLLELMSTEGVLYDIHKNEEDSTVILSNNQMVKIKEIRKGRDYEIQRNKMV